MTGPGAKEVVWTQFAPRMLSLMSDDTMATAHMVQMVGWSGGQHSPFSSPTPPLYHFFSQDGLGRDADEPSTCMHAYSVIQFS